MRDKFAREWNDEWKSVAESTIANKADIERYHNELQLPVSSLPAAGGFVITDRELAETEVVIENVEEEDEHLASEIEERLNLDRIVLDLVDQNPIEIEPEDEHYIPEEADRYRAERTFLIDWWTTTQDIDHGAMLCRPCIAKGHPRQTYFLFTVQCIQILTSYHRPDMCTLRDPCDDTVY